MERSQLEKLSLKRQELEAAGVRGQDSSKNHKKLNKKIKRITAGLRGRDELAAAAWQQVHL